MNGDLLANRIIWHRSTFGISVSVCSSNTPFPPVDNLIILVKLESSGESPSRYDMCLSTCLFTALCNACLKMKRTTGNFKESLNILSLSRKRNVATGESVASSCLVIFLRAWVCIHSRIFFFYIHSELGLDNPGMHFLTATIHTKILPLSYISNTYYMIS